METTVLKLMTVDEVAKVLHRSPGGLRQTMRQNSALGRRLRNCTVRIGRRVLFRESELAALIQDGVQAA